METGYRCPECGNERGLYVRADLRWCREVRKWVPCSGMEDAVDCTECDHVGPIATFEYNSEEN